MFKQNATEKYIGQYLKKHYPKRNRSLRFGSMAYELVATLAEGVKSVGELLKYLDEEGAFDLLRFPSWHERTPRAFHCTRSQLARRISNMERSGLLRRKSKQTVFLTPKCVAEILKYRMKNKRTKQKWDGKWRVIVFDIQEITRKDRDFLRRQLKWIGFEELQESVWIFPYEIRDELREFIKMCQVDFQGDVRFILAESIQPDILLREKFALLQQK